MEVLHAFFAGEIGWIIASGLLLMGITDCAIGYLVFGKRAKTLQAHVTPGMPPEEKKTLEAQLQGIRTVARSLYLVAGLFILAGLYGVSVTFSNG